MGQLHDIRIGPTSSESWNADKGIIETTHSAVYVVEMDEPLAREPDVAQVFGVPNIGHPSPILPGAWCVNRDMEEVAPRWWDVECEFSNSIGGKEPEDDDTDPWDLLPSWRWGSETIEEPLLFDAQDPTLAMVNSAGESLPPITMPITVPVLTIKRIENFFTGDTILSHANRVNSAEFWGAPANKAWLASIEADPRNLNGSRVWDTVYKIRFKMDTYGWVARILDQGTYYWTGAVGTSQKLPFGDDAFQQVLGNLDGTGKKNTTNTPAWVTRNRLPKVDFNDLNLGPF